ncbi:MAG: hypothetical protein HY718_20855 [Planctomycetes bacterium]|nr:hypothetical protein [Planctomycetota bacterium]
MTADDEPSGRDSPAGEIPGGLIQIDVWGSSSAVSGRLWIIVLLVALLILGSSLRVWMHERWHDRVFILLMVACAAIGWFMYRVSIVRSAAALRTLLRRHADAPLDAVLQPGTPTSQMVRRLIAAPRHLAKALAAGRCAGYALTVAPWGDVRREKIEPLTVPFEPVPLDTSEDAFQGLASSRPDRSTATATARHRFTTLGLARQLYPMLVATGTAALLLRGLAYLDAAGGGGPRSSSAFGSSTFLLILFLIQVFSRDHFGAGSLFFVPFFLVQMSVDLQALSLPGSTRWAMVAGWVLLMTAWWALRRGPTRGAWVMPGGLLLPSRREVYRRDAGLLVWYPGHRRLWAIDTTAARVAALDVTSEEAVLALRAWLSPLPTPSDEMLHGFLPPP